MGAGVRRQARALRRVPHQLRRHVQVAADAALDLVADRGRMPAVLHAGGRGELRAAALDRRVELAHPVVGLPQQLAQVAGALALGVALAAPAGDGLVGHQTPPARNFSSTITTITRMSSAIARSGDMGNLRGFGYFEEEGRPTDPTSVRARSSHPRLGAKASISSTVL